MERHRLTHNCLATEWVSVFLERNTPPHCNLHAGILYRDVDNKLFKLHFAFHYDLRRESVAASPPRMVAALLELDDRSQPDRPTEEFIAGVCERIASRAHLKEIAYNLKEDESVVFNKDTGEVHFGIDSTGLGCGTFVLAVFRSLNNRLIDTTGWPPPTDEDVAVQRTLHGMLVRKDQAHAKKVEPEIGMPRISPECVIGSCLEAALPALHAACHANSLEVVAFLDAGPQANCIVSPLPIPPQTPP